MKIDSSNWASYPFEVNGVKFLSQVDPAGDIYAKVALLPKEIFEQMNINCVMNTIGNPATMTKSELIAELARVNEGASQALVVLA